MPTPLIFLQQNCNLLITKKLKRLRIMKKEAIALLMNDLHITSDNILEFNKNWKEALQICKERKIIDLIIGGDIFTARASQTLPVLLAVKDALVAATIQGLYVTIAYGNHDCSNAKSIESYCHLYSSVENVNVIDTYKRINFNADIQLCAVSYFPENDGFKEVLDNAIEECRHTRFGLENTILYIHEGVHGALGDFEIDKECPQEWFEGFKAVLCGHYHNRVKIKGTNIEYIGASRQCNFGEDEMKGYTILYSDGSYEFVQNEVNIRYRTIEADYDDDLQLDDDPRYKTRLKLNCTDAQAKTVDKEKLHAMGFNKIELKTEKVRATEVKETDLDQRFDKQGIKKEYKRFCNTKEIEPDLGLKYLERLR